MSDTMSTRAQHGGEFRQEITVITVSHLSSEGQEMVKQEWGLPDQDGSRITHLVFCITPSRHNDMHGPDDHLNTLFRTSHSFVHYQYQEGCYKEGTAIRLFRDFSRDYDPALVVLSKVKPIFVEVCRRTEARRNYNVRRSIRELWRQNS